MRTYEITKEYTIKAVKALYEDWLGQPLTHKQYLINTYIMFKAQLDLPIEDEDYNIDPLHNDEDMRKYQDLLRKVNQIERAPHSYEHLYSFKDDESHTWWDYATLWAKMPFRFSYEIIETTCRTTVLTEEERSIINDYQNVMLLNKVLKYLKIDQLLFPPYEKNKIAVVIVPKSSDFIHDESVRHLYKKNDDEDVGGPTPVDTDTFKTKWSFHSDHNTDSFNKFSNSSSEIFPFSALDDYKSIQLYFLYKNSGVNYVDYSTSNHRSSYNMVEKMLSYSSSNLYQRHISNKFGFDWDSIILKVFNLNYRDTFISPLYNFINSRTYDKTRHTRADPLLLSASIFRNMRRPLVRKGGLLNYPGIRQFLDEHRDIISEWTQKSTTDKFTKLRTSEARSSLKGSRFKSGKFLYGRKDHQSLDLSVKHPLFYDFLDYYRSKANINPLARLSFKAPVDKGYVEVPNRYYKLEIPGWSGYQYAPLSERIGSRLYRKMAYVNRNIDSDSGSVHITYMNRLQDYLKSDLTVSTSSFGSLDSLYDSYLHQLTPSQKNSLFDLYFFRSDYLKDRYNRLNFTNLLGRTQSSSWKKQLLGRNKYSTLNAPSHLFDQHVQQYRPYNVKLSKYDLLTRFKLELISSSGIKLTNLEKVMSSFKLSNLDYAIFNLLEFKEFFMFGLSALSLLGLTIFNFYSNFEMIWYNLFNDLALYPWMNPIIKNAESFWYSSQYFHLSFDSLEKLMHNSDVQYGTGSFLTDFNINSPYDQLKDDSSFIPKVDGKVLGLDKYLYSSNEFFSNQYAYYNYQSKNLIKLPYHPINNSGILFFQWDNLPLFDLVSQGYNTNLYRHFEQMTYNVFKYDVPHVLLLLMKDFHFNFIFSYDDSIFYYFYYCFISFFSVCTNIFFFLLSYCLSSLSLWIFPLFFKFGLISSLEVLNTFTNNLTFLNLKHIFIDLPYWYVIDLVSGTMFHWKWWLMPYHHYLQGTYWVPLWYIYDFFDNYLRHYILDFFYNYYRDMADHPTNLLEVVFSNYCLSIYWAFFLPLFYIARFLLITVFIESYGFFLILVIVFLIHLTAWNNSKKNAWVFKNMNSYSIRNWMRKYQAVHDIYLNTFIPNDEILAPYGDRSFSSPTDLISHHNRDKSQVHSTVPPYRNPIVSGSSKFPKYQLNYYNYPNITEHLFNPPHDLRRFEHKLKNKRNQSLKSSFYENVMFSNEYVQLNHSLKYGITKFPLFRSYPLQVQPYFRKAVQSFSRLNTYNNELFSASIDHLIPFILLGKHFEDQNFIASLQVKDGHIIKELFKSNRIYDIHSNLYHRFYFLRKYFPFYYRHSSSLFRLKSLQKRYKNTGTTSQIHNVQYKYLLWDGGSHNMFLFPGISSLMDEHPSELLTHGKPAYEETITEYYYSDDSMIFESETTDGILPTFDADFNFGTQYSEHIHHGARILVNTIERQRKIVYNMTTYRPGFDHIYNDKAAQKFMFHYKLSRPRSDKVYYMSDDSIYVLDRVQQYYYSHFSSARDMRFDLTSLPHSYSTQLSSDTISKRREVDFSRTTTRKSSLSLNYSWHNYKTSLLWYINELKHKSSIILNDNWVRDYDLGDLFKDTSFELNLLKENQLYPTFYYNTLGNDYAQSYAWYKIYMLHHLKPRYVKHKAEHWEFTNSWSHDMTFVDNRDVNDSLYKNTLSSTIGEIFDDADLNGKLLPPFVNVNFRNIYMDSLYTPRKNRNHYHNVYRQDLYTRKILMGKYYRLAHTISSLNLNKYFQSLPQTSKRSYDKMQLDQHFFHAHYLGRAGKLDFFVERFSYDFDNGWVKLFNLINYKKYKHQIPAIEKPSRLFNKMLRESDIHERIIKDISYLDSFANASLFTSFYEEFGDLSSGIYHAWLSQQSYSRKSIDSGFNFLDSTHKFDYLLGTNDLNNLYGYSKFALIKDSLRDSHNYENYTTGNSNYPVSLKSVENYYDYDRYTYSPWTLDIRYGSMFSQLSQRKEPILPSEHKSGYSNFRHFRGKGARIFNYHRDQNYPKRLRISPKEISLLERVGISPGELALKKESLIDLFSNRVLTESCDHFFNYFDLNLDFLRVDYRPIHFYKVPNSIGDNWLDFSKSIMYYDWYDVQALNDLKQYILNTSGGSWKYDYLSRLMESDEYDYLFESNLKNRHDNSLDYNLLERYCEQEITGGLLTKRYLIYREKIKSISPNASLFFHDFYPDYIWEFYEFDWYEEVRSDWFFIVPAFALFFVYYMSLPHDYYKFARKRVRQTLYVSHIRKRKTGGPKNFNRRLFPQPSRLKKRRLKFYKLQSKNNIISTNPLNDRYNLRGGDYLGPYNVMNPGTHAYTSQSFLRFRTRYHRSRRLLNPRKYVFYSGYNIQLRHNRRKARRMFKRRLKAYNKDQLYSTLKLFRGVDPYYSYKLKDKEFDSYKKSWSRIRIPKSNRRFKRKVTPMRKPYTKPFRRYYSFDFYKTMLTNDLLKLFLTFKAFISSTIGSLWIILLHFLKYSFTYDRFKYTFSFIWDHKYELIPSLQYFRNYLYGIFIPRITYILLYLSSNTNPYSAPFSFNNRKRITRHWKHNRRNFRDRMSLYTAVPFTFLNYIVVPFYNFIFKPFYNVSFHLIQIEKQIMSTLGSNIMNGSIFIKLNALSRLLTSPVAVHSSKLYSSFCIYIYSCYFFIKSVVVSILLSSIYSLTFILGPVTSWFFFITFKLLHIVLIVVKPIINAFFAFQGLIYTFLQPFNLLYNYVLGCLLYTFFFIQLILSYIYSLFLLVLLKPFLLCAKLAFSFDFSTLHSFIKFYVLNFKLLSSSTTQYIVSFIGSSSNFIFYPLFYLYRLFIRSPLHLCWAYVQMSVCNFLYFSNVILFLYIEPLIFYIIYIYNIVMLKFSYYFGIFFTFMKHNVFYIFTFKNSLYYLNSSISFIFNSIWSFLLPLLKLFLSWFLILFREFLNSYFIIYLLSGFFILSLSSILLNISIFVISSAVLLKVICSYCLYYVVSFVSILSYATYLFFSPGFYYIFAFFKLFLFIFVLIIKLFVLYFCLIVYLLVSILNCYIEYLYSDMSFVSFILSLYYDVALGVGDYVFNSVLNYFRNVIHFIFKYSIYNFFYDGNWNYDRYTSEASAEFHRSYTYLKNVLFHKE